MHPARLAAAIVCAVVGIVWLGQGLGYIAGSFMTSDRRWALVGGVLLLVAITLGWSARRR